MGWYPVECEHGYDHCPTCDAPRSTDPSIVVMGVDPATGDDRTVVWCNMCGKETVSPGECDLCREWWVSNPPPGPDYSTITRDIAKA